MQCELKPKKYVTIEPSGRLWDKCRIQNVSSSGAKYRKQDISLFKRNVETHHVSPFSRGLIIGNYKLEKGIAFSDMIIT